MKRDGEGKMNAVEKQGVVHVSSRPAIVGTSQSVTLLIRFSFVTSKTLSSLYTVGRLATSCMIFHREHPLGQSSVPAFTEIAPFLLLQKPTLLA